MIEKSVKARHIFTKLQQVNPQPTTELNYSSGFELLVAVILSAQATDLSVNKVTVKLFAVANTPAQILKLGLDGLTAYIQSIGLYRNKAKNIILMSQQLIEQFNNQVPTTRDELESLAGVGRKTANVILNTLFNEPVIVVDTHIFRVARRLGLSQGLNVLQVEQDLIKVIPPEFLLNAHHWLILHGRYVCKARKPNCAQCIIKQECDSYLKSELIGN